MGKSTNDGLSKTSIIRLILGCCIGFIVGNRILQIHYPKGITVNTKSCVDDKRELLKLQELNSDFYKLKKQFSKSHKHSTLYIGVISAEKNLGSRISTVFATWAKSSAAHVEVFAKNNGTINFQHRYVFGELGNGVRVIQLPGVKDTVYPPQKKSFSMIKFMYDFYINKFDWFVRLDDDAYINVEKLKIFLNRIDASKPWYLGSPGFGRDSGDKIRPGENYCMGGPGVFMSRGLLRKLGPKLGECLHSLLTDHEDIELGRCITKMAGVKCTVAWETRDLFYQNYEDGINSRNIRSISNNAVDKGLAFHANKDEKYQIKLHVSTLQRKIAKRQEKIMKLTQEIKKSIAKNKLEKASPLESQFVWNAFLQERMYLANAAEVSRQMRTGRKISFIDSAKAAAAVIKTRMEEQHSKLRSVSVLQSYQVVNPAVSVDTISHLMCKFSSSNNDQQTQENIVLVPSRQYFSNISFWKENGDLQLKVRRSDERKRCMLNAQRNGRGNGHDCIDPNEVKVNFIVSLSGRPDNFLRFLENFEKTFLSRGENVNLIISYFPPPKSNNTMGGEVADEFVYDVDAMDMEKHMISDENFIMEKMRRLNDDYPSSRIEAIIIGGGAAFSRGLGLQTAANVVTNENEIIFLCDVDLVFTPEIMLHIRGNTVQGKQVYYPVFFSQYDPQAFSGERLKPDTHFRFEEDDGFWRSFSYGMVSVYKSDFMKTGGFDLSIKGWGLEDLLFVKEVITHDLAVFKSNEPAEVHIFHDKFCDPSLTSKQLDSCKKSRASHFGSKSQLYKLWKKKKD